MMNEKMTQDQLLYYLVEAFKADSGEYKHLQTPPDQEGKRRILRSLMNIRMPRELPDAILKAQDEYLSARAEEKGIVRLSDIPVIRDGISVWQGDITRLAADAIVNAANSQMLGCFVPMHTCKYLLHNLFYLRIVHMKLPFIIFSKFLQKPRLRIPKGTCPVPRCRR